MHAQADKSSDHRIQSSGDTLTQNKDLSKNQIQFEDNRPEVIAQRKLQSIARNSPQMHHAAQLQSMVSDHTAHLNQTIQRKENNTGLPDHLKTGVENLSGYSMDDVKVHYNSDKPAQLHAHAYAQGTDIHIGPGQEKHLPHEAWHVVQQKQGRVKPTIQMKGQIAVNDDADLEKEADIMGAQSLVQRVRSHYISANVEGSVVQKNGPDKVKLKSGKYQWDMKGIGLSVIHTAENLKEENMCERVEGNQSEKAIYSLSVQHNDGEWGDFHYIPHSDTLNESVTYEMQQYWYQGDEKVPIPKSGYKITKEITKLENTYKVTIKKTPAMVNVGGVEVSAGEGSEISISFEMIREGNVWKKKP